MKKKIWEGPGRMAPFLSTVINRIDAKGRVSLPAVFRAVVREANLTSVICFPSFSDKAIEGCTMIEIEKLSRSLDQMPPFSAERDALAELILGNSHDISFDSEGRIKLPAALVEFAGIDGEVMFIGMGRKFQIWNPTLHQEMAGQRRELARQNRSALTFLNTTDPSGGGAE